MNTGKRSNRPHNLRRDSRLHEAESSEEQSIVGPEIELDSEMVNR